MSTFKKVEFVQNLPKTTEDFNKKCPRTALTVKDPLYLDRFPSEPCPCAVRKILSLQRGSEMLDSPSIVEKTPVDAQLPQKTHADLKRCPWYIISEKSQFCYWVWEANPINQRQYTLEAISLLFGTSCINVWLSECRAKEKLKNQNLNEDDFETES